MADVVKEFIELKEKMKKDQEMLSALDTIILAEHREDPRIKIIAGRKSLSINADTYDNLKAVGVVTTVTEVRNKNLEEFDVDIQKMILENPNNYTEKVSKESIRIVKEKE